MYYLSVAFIFFAGAVWGHIRLCQRRWGQGLLAKEFFSLGLVYLFLCWVVFFIFPIKNTGDIWSLPLPGVASLIYVLLIPTYTIFYVSTELNSPTKSVLLIIHQNNGATYTQLEAHFTDDNFILPRLKDLEQTRCFVRRGDVLYLSNSGKAIAMFLNVYQVFLGRKVGG